MQRVRITTTIRQHIVKDQRFAGLSAKLDADFRKFRCVAKPASNGATCSTLDQHGPLLGPALIRVFVGHPLGARVVGLLDGLVYLRAKPLVMRCRCVGLSQAHGSVGACHAARRVVVMGEKTGAYALNRSSQTPGSRC